MFSDSGIWRHRRYEREAVYEEVRAGGSLRRTVSVEFISEMQLLQSLGTSLCILGL